MFVGYLVAGLIRLKYKYKSKSSINCYYLRFFILTKTLYSYLMNKGFNMKLLHLLLLNGIPVFFPFINLKVYGTEDQKEPGKTEQTNVISRA